MSEKPPQKGSPKRRQPSGKAPADEVSPQRLGEDDRQQRLGEDDRQQRLAGALRDNLRRRKAQKQARQQGGGRPTDGD